MRFCFRAFLRGKFKGKFGFGYMAGCGGAGGARKCQFGVRKAAYRCQYEITEGFSLKGEGSESEVVGYRAKL